MKKLLVAVAVLLTLVLVSRADEPVYDHFVYLPWVVAGPASTPHPHCYCHGPAGPPTNTPTLTLIPTSTPTETPTPTSTPSASRATPTPTALPTLTPSDAAACGHPDYDELVNHVGEQVCYVTVRIEKVYVVNAGTVQTPTTECAFIASVSQWDSDLIWVRDASGPCDYLWAGRLVPLRATVLGMHTIVGPPSLVIPSMEVQ